VKYKRVDTDGFRELEHEATIRENWLLMLWPDIAYEPTTMREKMDSPINTPESPIEEFDTVLEYTAEVVSAYVGNNPVSTTELPSLIGEVYGALVKARSIDASGSFEKSKPAVPVKKSLNDDYLICLEDGKQFKSLKRHLRSHYDLSPEQYREKWGLPHDYPMVAPNYAKARSQLARNMGLGRKAGEKVKSK